MDKQAAINMIADTFNSSFNENRFRHFIRNLFNEFNENKNASWITGYIKDSFKDHVKKYKRIGKYKDIDGNKLDVVVVHLRKESALDSARTMQRNFIASYLKTRGEKDAAVVAYFTDNTDDWRFSYVRMEYRQKITESGKIKVKEEFTSRRYSFLVGKNEPNHTAQQQLLPILQSDSSGPTLKEIEKAFDIETVTKEFFLKYRELFLHTKEDLDRVVEKNPKIKADFESKGVDTVNFAKKLLGQIIFLYFLQKKGWFGVGRDNNWGTGSKHFLRELFKKKHSDYNNLFNDILEPLFYEALRTGEDREHEDYYYSRFDCKIPFLNGGLFDPIGNYDWVRTDILIPDKLFSNNVKTKDGDKGTGILDVFDRYNFTVKEDEPLEKEVAIDPELLGKSYEKFNAIRPDNFDEFKKALKSGKKGEENKFNKKFGVYYTPREIVHYMCQQSLINYLDTAVNTHKESITTKPAIQKKIFGPQSPVQQILTSDSYKPIIPKKDIETLIHTGQQFSENEARVLSKGKETKTYSHQLPESIRKNAKQIDDKLAEITVCDPAVGSGAFPVGMMSEIVKARNVLTPFLSLRGAQATKQSHFDDKRTLYNFKRRCIEHSLYGVDIDPGAVEIAKLRLWLSLVVDEENIKNIKPLPNLDYKIMQGNSLIELLSTESLISSIDQRRTELVKELKKAKDELFNITMPTQKENKRREIDILMKNLFEYDRDKQIKRLKDDILAVKSQQRLFEDDKDKKEDEKKIRKIKSRIEEIKNIDVPGPTEHFEWHVNYSEIFQTKGGFDVVIANPPWGVKVNEEQQVKLSFGVNKSLDSSEYFILRSEQLMYSLSILTFIVPKSMIFANNWKTSRKFLLDRIIIDVADAGITFENVNLESFVFVVKNAKNSAVVNTIRINNFEPVKKYTPIKVLHRLPSISQDVMCKADSIIIADLCLISKSIVNKIQKSGQFLDSIQREVFRGLYIPDSVKEKILDKGKGLYVNKVPDVSLYTIKRIRNIDLSEIYKTKERVIKKLNRDRIIVKVLRGKKLTCTFAERRILTTEKLVNLVLKDANYSYFYILGLLNSSLTSFYFSKAVFSDITETSRVMDDCYLSKAPIKKINTKEQKPFISLVDKILTIKRNNTNANISILEREIDQLVYKLYDLTPEEIKIVEGENEKTKRNKKPMHQDR